MTFFNTRRFAPAAQLTTLLALTLQVLPAQAASVSLNLAGWQARGGFGNAGNTGSFVNLPTGATVTGFSYTNLAFSTLGDSWLRELVLSVNDSATPTSWLDWSPSSTDAPGNFGPAAGAWGDAIGMNGPFGSTGAFVASTGAVWLTTYLSYSVPPVGVNIQQGTLQINYSMAVPEPASYALCAVALLALGATTRRRISTGVPAAA